MGGLDGPVSAIEGEQALGGSVVRGEAGDAVGGLAVALAGLDVAGVAVHGEDLSDTGESGRGRWRPGWSGVHDGRARALDSGR